MLSWLRRLLDKTPQPAASPEPPPSADFGNIFGAATAAPAQAQNLSLEIPPEPELRPEPRPEPAPAPQPPAAPATIPARDAVEALIAAQRFADAGRVLQVISPHEGGQAWCVLATLQVAQQLRQPEAALAAARALMEMQPANPAGHVAASFALRLLRRGLEAEAAVTAALAACPDAPTVWIEAAQSAEGLNQVDLALARWAEVRRLMPQDPAGWQGGLRLACRLPVRLRPEILVPEALARFPDDPLILTLAARNAARLSVWDQAASLWHKVVNLHPDDPDLALEAVTSMMGPRAERSQRVPPLLPVLQALRERFPDFAPVAAAQVTALHEAGQGAEATALAADLRTRFPADRALVLAAASVAQAQGQPQQAVAILQSLRTAQRADWHLEAAMISALDLAGEAAEAESVCAAALLRFPGNQVIVEQHVTLASRRGDFAEAVRRAEHWRATHPRNQAIVRLAERISTLKDDTVAEAPVGDVSSLASLFTRFESLGATSVGCEFGIVQRQFGAEPLGLLRWGNMRTDGLTRALRARFEGLGEAEHTKIKAQKVAATDLEYFVYDERYHFWAHTFIKADEAPMDRVYQQTTRRLRFLRAKLIEDLEQAEKVFVFKVYPLEAAEPLLELFEAVRSYGPGTLLCVALADEAHKAGSVKMIQPGFFIGRVGMFGNAGLTQARGVDLPAWQSVCEAVASWHDNQRAQPTEPPQMAQSHSPAPG